MKITVKLYADLRRYSKGEGTIILELSDESRVNGILKYFRIPETETKIIMVNGIRAKPNTSVHDGDRIAIFPPIAGG